VMILDYLSSTLFVQRMAFIGGTNLRLIKGIDRFSEDLDFDCSKFSAEEFEIMTDEVVRFLQRSGLRAEAREKKSAKLIAFRRSIYIPELLFDLRLTGHREERFLIKIEGQDQGIAYVPQLVKVRRCGYFFNIQIPPDSILCAMKICAMLSRAKGRDFYDVMFLLAQTKPDFKFLERRCGIASMDELRHSVKTLLSKIDLRQKQKDFEHLLMNRENSRRILQFGEFIEELGNEGYGTK